MRINSNMSSRNSSMSSRGLTAGSKKIINSWMPAGVYPGLRSGAGMTGYTLLELLLVIAILSVLATFGLNLYLQQTIDTKITKTALQIQQLLEAATAYYVDNGCWPSTSNSTLCPNLSSYPAGFCTNPTPPPFDAYIPVGNTKNNWGNIFHCQPSSTGKKFQVFSGDMPPAFMTRLIARLPNAAAYTQDPQQVLAETAIPGQQTIIPPNVIIKMIDYTATMHDGDSYQIPTFSCPPNWNWNIDVFTSHLYPDNVTAFIPGSMVISLVTAQPNCQTVAADTYQCSLKALAQSLTGTFHPLSPLGPVRYTYIAYCTPPTAGKA